MVASPSALRPVQQLPMVSLAQDGALLNLVAGNQPLTVVFEALAGMVEQHIPGQCSLQFTYGDKRGEPIIAGAASEAEVDTGLLALARNIGVEPGIADWTRWKLEVHSRGHLLGELTLNHSRSHPFEAGEIELIQTAMRLASIAVEHRELHSDLDQQAVTDRTTGLPNKYAFEEYLSRSLRSSKMVEPVAVLWIGFERFNHIHESVGYRTTDGLLRSVGQRILGVLSKGEWLARVGPSEFAIVGRVAGAEAASECAGRVLRSLESAFSVNRYEFYLEPRIGIALFPNHGLTAITLQQNAANASYSVKNSGSAKYAFYEHNLGAGLRERMHIEADLRRAVENRELQLYYQPQTDLDGNLCGLEALIRWNHPKRGLLSPDTFIAMAEETGLIVPIGDWVIREACRQCAEWNRRLRVPVKVGVNVSALQLYFSDLPEIVATSLYQAGLPASCFAVELTETAVMRNAGDSAKALQKLRELGVTVAIDDFGIGYSSLNYLQKLSVDLLKIDRSFLQDIHSVTAVAVVRAVTALGHSLGIRVVAEGIETAEQMEAIRAIGVDIAQGFLIGKPMSADQALSWMEPHSAK